MPAYAVSKTRHNKEKTDDIGLYRPVLHGALAQGLASWQIPSSKWNWLISARQTADAMTTDNQRHKRLLNINLPTNRQAKTRSGKFIRQQHIAKSRSTRR